MPPPLGAAPPPHIFKYCQLLDITDNNERISMKFSGISLMARRRKWVKNTKICHPLLGLPQQLQPKEEWREEEGKSVNMSPPLGVGHRRLTRLSPRPAYGMCVGL